MRQHWSRYWQFLAKLRGGQCKYPAAIWSDDSLQYPQPYYILNVCSEWEWGHGIHVILLLSLWTGSDGSSYGELIRAHQSQPAKKTFTQIHLVSQFMSIPTEKHLRQSLMLWSPCDWTLAIYSIWGCLWRQLGNSSLPRMQQQRQLWAGHDIHKLHGLPLVSGCWLSSIKPFMVQGLVKWSTAYLM